MAGEGRFGPGELFAERYRIVGLLGKGGMGEVYRADDLKLAQPVALKFLPAAVVQDTERLDRFYNEVRVARQVSHPNVCRVYDVGEVGGDHYLSMEFVDGEDLSSLLRRIGRLPGDKALEISRQLCAGLAAAHDRGILHRDLKPENVMLDGRGRVRITDFGLAGLADHISEHDLRSGTPAYMSPEQLTGREVTTRSDVYSLGLVLYEVFSGRRAFEGRTFVELLRKHETELPTRPSTLVTDLDPQVEAVILRCLEKDPLRRPASALSVAAALPGGDPLAAALAAGETPSPEMVAAAGQAVAIAPARAWLLAAVTFVAAAAVPFAFAPGEIVQVMPFQKPPVVMADQARELLVRLGHDQPFTDSAVGYGVDGDLVRYVSDHDQSQERWSKLASGQPAALYFWYRQSPRQLVSVSRWRVASFNPPATVSGMAGVFFDVKGRLTQLYVVPEQVESAGEARTPDWAPLFLAARLDPARLTPVASRWNPPFATDVRSAWEGSYPQRPDVRFRVEAAGYHGKVAYFTLVHEWTRPDRQQPFVNTARGRATLWVVVGFLLSALVATVVLAYRNLQAGRCDVRGALRLALFSLVALLLAWALEANHEPDVGVELNLVIRGASLAVLQASFLAFLYLALEPAVRKLWPNAMISWSRLLSGRVFDPFVGAHVLAGTAYGAVLALAIVGINRGLMASGEAPGFPTTSTLDALLGPGEVVRYSLGRLLDCVVMALGTVLMLVGLRAMLRKQWLAALVLCTIVSLPDALSSSTPLWLSLPLTMLILTGPMLLAVFREGVLTLIVTVFTLGAVLNVPLTTDLSQWYAEPTKATFVLLLAIVGYGLRGALRGARAAT